MIQTVNRQTGSLPEAATSENHRSLECEIDHLLEMQDLCIPRHVKSDLHKWQRCSIPIEQHEDKRGRSPLRAGEVCYLAKPCGGCAGKGLLERIFSPLPCDGNTKKRILGDRGWRVRLAIRLHLLVLGISIIPWRVRCKLRRIYENSWASPPCVKWLVGAFQSSTGMEKIGRGRGE